MKKFTIILTIFLFVMFIPFFVNAEICEPEKVTIESIEINKKTSYVTEKSEPIIKGRELNLNLRMVQVGDYIEYKMIVKNDSKEDYELDKTSLSNSSDYINYIFQTYDNSNIVKSGETKEVILKVQYKNEVPNESFEDGIYTDKKNLLVNLSTEETITNPKTGISSYILISVIAIFICIATSIMLKQKNYLKLMVLIISTAIIIPISVYAICKCDIKVNSSVEIVKKQKFKIRIVNCAQWINDYFEFDYGMTIRDWVNSDYINDIIQKRIIGWHLEDNEESWEATRLGVIEDLLDYFTTRMGYDEDYVIQPNDFLDYYETDC